MPENCTTGCGDGELKNASCYLKDLDIFEGIAEPELIRIANSAYNENYETGDEVYSPKEPASNIYVIKEGEVALFHMVEGKKHIFDVLGPGSVFGHFQAKGEKPNHFAEASRKTMLCVTPVDEFLDIVSAHPEIMLRFMKRMSERLQDYEQKIRLNQVPAKERIYHELKRLEEKRNQNFFQKMFARPLRVTHEEIASLTGLNRVTVTRALKNLKEDGCISVHPDTGTITFMK